MEIRKEAQAGVGGAPSAMQLEKINALAKARLNGEQVYVFSLRLCDDQMDRDFERFDTQALPELARMFLGKTGIVDHQWSTEKQVARIFETQVVQDGSVSYIKAWAYIRRGGANEETIADIEAGIKKEVSVGCAMGQAVCSICGGEYGTCGHSKGQSYDGQVCCAILRQPVDAYEFSFVAVPAQREAGVLKRFGQEGRGAALLEKQAALGRKYLEQLRREVVRLAMLADDGLDGRIFAKAAERLEEPELLELRRAYDARAEKRFARPQLRQLAPEERGDETAFLV